MPIYRANGKTYDIPEDKVSGFEAKYPNATETYYVDQDEYEIPISKREGFLKKFPGASMQKPESEAFAGLKRMAEGEVNPAPSYALPQGVTMPSEDRTAEVFSGRTAERNFADAAKEYRKAKTEYRANPGEETAERLVSASQGIANEEMALQEEKEKAALRSEGKLRSGVKAGWDKGASSLKRGTQYLAGEMANLVTGSSLDDKDIIDRWDEFMKLKNDQYAVASGADAEKVQYIKELENEYGSLEAAKQEIEKRSRVVSWGDKQMTRAAEVMNSYYETEGAGAWVGEMIPQMVPAAASMVVSAITKSPTAAKVVGGLGMTALTTATAGQSMKEARDYGAENWKVWAVGLGNGAIELVTEVIPYNRYTKRVVDATAKKVGKTMADAVTDSPAARGELEKLLVKANEELGGKLLGGKNVKEYLGDIAAEGLSEFSAEALQTITPMLYQNPEDYPTLWEVVKAGWEGAKGGIFMGTVLGGVSKGAEYKAHDQRRKSQGYVDVTEIKADGKDKLVGIAEVVGEREGNYLVMIDGKVEEVSKNRIGDIRRFDYSEFKAAENVYDYDEHYQEGYTQEANGSNAISAVREMQEAEVAVRYALELDDNADVNAYLNGRTSEELAQGDEIVKDIIDSYVQAKARVEGMRDKFQEVRQAQYTEADNSIDNMSNNGMVYSTEMDGEEVFITGGNVVLNENGTVDIENSSEVLYVRRPDNTVRSVACENIPGEVTAESAENLKAARRAEIDEKWKADFEAAEAEPASQGVDQVAPVAQQNPNDFTLELEGEQYHVQVEDGVVKVDGEPVEWDAQTLADARAKAGVASEEVKTETEVADTTTEEVELPDVYDFFRLDGKNYAVVAKNADGSVGVMVDGKRAVLPAGTDYSAAMPTDKNGELQFTKMPAERTLEYFSQRVPNENARAQMIENNRKRAESALKKFDKEPNVGTDPDAYEATMKKWEADKEAALVELDYWGKVAELNEGGNVTPEVVEATESVKAEETAPIDQTAVEVAQETQKMEEVAPMVEPAYTEEEIADAQAFVKASSANTTEAYQEYLDNYPEGAYRNGARGGIWMIEGTNPETHGEVVDARNAAMEVLKSVDESKPTGEVVSPVEEKQPLRDRAQEWTAKTGIPVMLIETEAEVTNEDARKALKEGRDVTGWFEAKSGAVALYMPHLHSAKDVDLTYIHEVVAHKGLRALMGDKFDALCDKVWESMSEDARSRYLDYVGEKFNSELERQRAAADEYMAFIAEGIDLTEADKTVWDKIVEFFCEFVESFGTKLTDAEIETLIKASYANLKNMQEKSSGEGDFRARKDSEGARFSKEELGDVEELNDRFNRELQQQIEGTLPKVHMYQLGMPSSKLLTAEIDNLPIELPAWNLLVKSKKDYKSQHPYNLSDVKDLVRSVHNPIAVFDSEEQNGKKVILTELKDKKNHNFIAVLDIRRRGGRNYVEINSVISLYPKDSAIRIAKWFDSEKAGLTAEGEAPLLKWADKNKTLIWLSSHSSDVNAAGLSYKRIANIVSKFEKANTESEKSASDGTKLRKDNPTLIGTHSLTEEKLRKAIKMGGLANPSTAIFEMGEEMPGDYGEITFVMPSSMVDKKTGRNTGAYAGDAWTPTYPHVERQMGKRGSARAREDVQSVPKEMQKEVRMGLDSWLDGREGAGLAYMFLQEEGMAPELSRVAKKYPDEVRNRVSEIAQGEPFYRLSPEQKQQVVDLFVEQYYNGDVDNYNGYLKEKVAMLQEKLADESVKSFIKKNIQQYIDGVNEYGYEYESVSDFLNKVQRDINHSGGVNDMATTQEAARIIREQGLEKEFQKWKEELLARYEIKEVIFKGFTPTGNRKYVPHTLENVSKDMKEQGRNGAVGLNASFSKFAAGLLKPLGSLDAIRKRKGNLRPTHADTEAFRNKWSEVYYDLAEKLQPDATGYEDYGLDRVAEAATKKDPKAFIKSEYGIELSEADEKALKDMIWAIQNEYPVMYFETKFERPVYLDEFAGVVIPENTGSDVVESLENAGLKIETYEPGNEKARTEAIKRLTEEDDRIMFRRANKNQEVFVSNAQRAVEGIKQEKATPEQWIAMLKKNGGLKAGEEAWLGLEEWLNEKQGAVTKQEILDFIGENKIQIEEVSYSQFGYGMLDEAAKKLETETKEIGWDAMQEKYPGIEDFFEYYNGEVLWNTTMASIGEYEDFVLDNKIVYANPTDNAINESRESYTTEGLERKREIALVVPTVEPYNQHDEIHFGDAGNGRAVAWVRFGETTDSEGNRVLVIDEIQSKRHQDGREKGYRSNADKFLKDNGIEVVETDTHIEFYKNGEIDKRFAKALFNTDIEKAKNLYVAGYEKTAVPSAPFEKNWHELAMKRMLRLAAEEGFDKVAWTTGEQQAERYNLGAVLNGLKAYKTSANEYYVIPYNNGAIGEFVKEYTEQELADTFGKELAQKIITNAENATEENPYEIEGEEFRFGGEGMKGFYDKMLPSFVSKYTKKWGAKVGSVKMPSLEQNNVMHSVDVTPEMKESVMEGQTMFRFTDADRQAMDFRRTHRGSANIVVIDADMMTAGLLAQGFNAEEIVKIRELHKKGSVGFYSIDRNTIYLLGKNLGREENEGTFWHENTHKAIVDLDVPQEILDEFYSMPSEEFIKKFEELAIKGYNPEDYPEEFMAYYIEHVRDSGRHERSIEIMGVAPEKVERVAQIVEPIINYINYGRRRVDTGTERVSKESGNLRDSGVETLPRGEKEGTRLRDTRFHERESIDDIPTQPLTLVERVKNSLLEAAAKNKENLQLRADALRTYGRDVANVLKLMGKQREYDKSTVDQLVKLARMYFRNAQLLGEVTPYEVTRIMGALNRAVGKRDITNEANTLMNILLDAHAKALDDILEKAEKIKAKKVNAAGVEVMGSLDKYAQETIGTYRDSKGWDQQVLDESIIDSANRLAEAEDMVRKALGLSPVDDVDAALDGYVPATPAAENAIEVYRMERARFEGFDLAREYRENVHHYKTEISQLNQELKDAGLEVKKGNIDRRAYNELKRSIEDAIMQSKAEMIDGYHGVISRFTEDVRGGRARAKQFVQEQVDRARDIQHNANSDMEGNPANVQGAHPDKWNGSVPRLFMSAMPTFQNMLKKFGEKAVDGKGYLYTRFMPQATQAADKEFRGKVSARLLIEAKLEGIYDKKMSIEKFMNLSRKHGVTISYKEGGVEKSFDLNKGQMLYIYMVNKMADGQMKLRKMGITEDLVADIAERLDPKMVRFADWAQNELLTDLRGKYNEVHERMFGAPMASIDNYFPLKIKKEARGEKADVGRQDAEEKPSTVTGSIIKRTKNATAIDLSADAMSVLIEHIDNMEHWAAFAEFNRDLNTLLNYRHFQNQVKGMTTIRYGSGDVLWKNFQKVAAIASGEYRPKASEVDKAVMNIAKGITRSKINFRTYTAVKQLLSAPAFWNEAGFMELMKAYRNPMGSWNWALENLPGFKERWEGRAMGNEKLMPEESDWKIWRNKFVENATKWGMAPNAAIDAMTVAQGARAVYLTKLQQFKKAGFSHEQANAKALQAAAEAYNESQQSSEGAYLAPIQKDGTVASAILTTFKNANFGYTRKTAQAVSNILRKMHKGYKEETIAFMAKKLEREGLTPEQAKAYATKIYKKSKYKDVVDVAMFGFGLNILWELGGIAIYLMAGDDDETKEKMREEAALRGALGVLNGIPGGETIASGAMAVAAGDANLFRLPELVAVGDVRNLVKVLDTDMVKGVTDLINMLTASGIGVNPQVITDLLVAIGDFDPEEFGMFVLRAMAAPTSQTEQLEVDKAMEDNGKRLEEIAVQYVEYKKKRQTPLTGWMYTDEGEQKAMERYAGRFDKMLDERLEKVVENTDEYQDMYEHSNPYMKEKLSKMRKAYLEGNKEVTFEKLEIEELINRKVYGANYKDTNVGYFNLTTSEDEDMAFLIDEKLKALKPVYDEAIRRDGEEFYNAHKEEIDLYVGLNDIKNAVNANKKLLKENPTEEAMSEIRRLRNEAIDLINHE